MFLGWRNNKQKIWLSALIMAIGFNFVIVKSVHALIPIPVTVVAEPVDEIKKGIGATIASAVWSGLGYFIDKLTYETAVWVASGNLGQKPMWMTSGGAFFDTIADGAIGEMIYNFGENNAFLKKYGISLCVPPDLKFQLWLQLNMAEQWQPATPHCSFNQIKNSWQQLNPYSDDYNPQRARQALSGIGVGFRPGQNDLSVLLGANSAVTEYSARQREFAKNEADYSGKAVAPKNTSGQAKVPVSTIEKIFEEVPTGEDTKKAKIAQSQSTSDALAQGNIAGVFTNVGRIFVNTLTNKLMNKLMAKGLLSLADLFGSDSEKAASAEAQVVGGRQAAEVAFAEFLKPNLPSVEQWNYTGELASDCSANPSPYCGVMDNSLQTALAQADSGGAVTVKQALEKGFLHGDWFLLPPDSDCPREAYCYENLVKLRQLRILPIGWELAAKASLADKPTSLQKAVDAFSAPAANNSFYHLIDPYWLIKAPVAKCGAMAYGANFLIPPATDGTGGQRGEYCADVQNCVQEDEAGQCNQGSWGYCLKEKNRWILGGDSCDAQFNTCTTYGNSNGQTASYLANTIEKSICNADNVGCRAYSTSSTLQNDQWQWNLGKKIYFDKDAQSCDYSNEGCSQFVRTGFGLVGGSGVSNEKVNLKKAPEYYNCYGEMQASVPIPWEFSSSTVQWAVNKADLSKIFDSWKPQNKEKCDNFAQVCSYEEVGCEKYTPANGDLPIPGILTANDQCPSGCVGYESFKQQDTNFETAPTELAYFIPVTAGSCQEQEAGCDEFVNLEAQAAGGEGKEYYTELRQCSQTESDGAVYYTWEGSDTAGYQLKSFNLKFTSATNASPMSTVTSDDDVNNVDFGNDTDVTCGPNSYKDHKASDDCREFYDKDGNKSYRLYTKTITISATDCKKLRKTVSDEVSCKGTSGVWEPTQKICTYLAIPKEGRSCQATAVGCRAYKGNAGNNFYPLPNFPITFENGAMGGDAQQLTGWAGKFSAESTVVGGKSLKVSNGYTEITTSLAKGATYSLSFWAKGLGEGLTVSVKPTDANGAAKSGVGADIIFNVSLHADWQNYTVGPIVIDWDESVAFSTLRFSSAAGKVFYLDNIIIKQMNANVYVVKNSWKTPSACDNLIGDEYGQSQGGSFTNPYRLVPQAMLGCQKYTDRQNQAVAVKSFTSMCREEAVGCEEFVDTHNNSSPSASFVNLLCKLNSINNSNQAVECKDNNNETRCSVSAGLQECRFTFVGDEMALDTLTDGYPDGVTQDVLGKQYNIEIKNDEQTVEIKADSKEYLVNDKNFYCTNDALGCSALGVINYSALNDAQALASAYLKNQPDIYGQILCEQKAEGCDEFKTTQGAAYFKDPGVKNNFCEYRENFNGWNAQTTFGWVQKGAGWCSGNSATLCYSDADCGSGKTCYDKDTVPCDAKWDSNGNIASGNYKLSLNGDLDYNGAVGLCPAEQNGCSEFIDPKDTSALHPNGTPYFVINNSKLDKSSCGIQVSFQEGCILFDETSKGVANWAAARTYIKSENNNNTKVNPVDCGSKGEKTDVDNPDCLDTVFDANNANTILKVQRDRVCGEWLACKSSMSVRDDAAVGGWKEMCTELAPCLEANSEATTLTGKCGKWADDNNELFTIDKYQERFQAQLWSWEVPEYSGYTLPEAYQISALSVNGKELANQKPIPPATAKEIFASKGAVAQSCRGFAQADTPNGQCSYTKVTYSAQNTEPITQYFPYNQLLGAEGVCSGGFDELGNSKNGLSCVHSGNCTDDRPLNPAESAFAIKEHGVCMLSKQISKSRGWEGYCLDPGALSAAANSSNVIASPTGAKQSLGVANQPKNCTLWYPLTTPSGSVSSDHLYASAGYVPPSGSGKYWCVEAKGNANRTDGVHYMYKLFKDDPRFFPPTDADYNENTLAFDVGTCQVPKLQKTDAFGESVGDPYCPSLTEAFGAQITNSEIINQVPPNTKIHLSEIVAIGLAPTDTYDDNWPGEEVLIFRDQHLADIKDIQPNKQDSDGRYWSGPVKAVGQQWAMDVVWVEDKNQPKEIAYERLDKSFCKTFKAGKEASLMAFRAIFDKDGMLKELRSKICDDGSNRSGMRMDLNIYLTEVCTGIRQVVDNDVDAQDSPMGFLAKGRTDKLWQASQYALGKDLTVDPKLDLQYNQMFAPFGSFGKMQDPIIKTISEYATSTVNAVKINQIRQAGMWPIWMSPGGATPLNCDGANSGDCGNIGLCSDGPNENMVCDTKNKNKDNGCEEIVDDGVCVANNLDKQNQKICSGITSGKDLLDSGIVCVDSNNNKASTDCPKPNTGYGQCQNGSCTSFSKISCSNNNDCIVTASSVKCDFVVVTWTCDGGKKDKQICAKDADCEGGTTHWDCETKNNVRGLCVGGKNHGLACGSSLDCPSRKYSDSSDETVEYGVCVGSSLDDGKNIPQTAEITYGTDNAKAGQWRLYELFVNKYATWYWDDATKQYNKQEGAGDRSDGWNTPVIDEWKVNPKPPTVTNITINSPDPNATPLVNGQLSGTGSFNAILRFRAWASYDQMPITRLAVDWGDGSDPYVMQGWFRNRKKECNVPQLIPGGNGKTRIFFGDSSDACEEGFYQFTHIYECKGSSDPKWNSSKSACIFIPKVQVLDNWGWCNSLDGKGRWNDNETDPKNDDKRNCYWGKTDPWTSFSGIIEVKP